MAEYRIVAVLDPSGVKAGSAALKQELRGVDVAADATKRNLAGVGSTSSSLATGNRAAAGSLDKLAASSAKVNDNLSRTGRAGKDAARGQADMEAAARKAATAVGVELAEITRLNRILEEARGHHARGAIDADLYAKVQARVATGVDKATRSLEVQRAGYRQLGTDFSSMVSNLLAGGDPFATLAQGAANLGQSLGMMGDGGVKAANAAVGQLDSTIGEVVDTVESAKAASTSLTSALGREVAAHEAVIGAASGDAKATAANTTAHAGSAVASNASATAAGRSAAGNLADAAAAEVDTVAHTALARAKMSMVGILAGPWGAAVTAAAAVLGSMATKLFEGAESVEDLTKKLKEDAEQAALTREAQAIFANTLDGVTDALRRNREALKALDDEGKTAARRALESAVAAKERLQGIRAETLALLDQTRVLLERNRAMMVGPETKGRIDPAQIEFTEAQGRLADIASRLAQIDADTFAADEQINEALSRRVVERQDMDAVEKIRARYDGPGGLIDLARRRALAEGTVSTALAAQVRQLTALRDAEVKAEQARTKKAPSDGVDRFRSREQAIGIAGRELQQGGLRVSENEQFGGVKANHPGMGNAAHGKFAVDVNVGKGITEANVPDLRARFDELARRYQARGYEVVWNGQFYAAGGDGPTRKAAGHQDHFHLQAPKTIIGMATQSSTEAAAMAEFRREQQEIEQAARKAEQQRDFVQGVVDEAGGRGGGNQVDTVQAQIERKLADYRRRFDEDMGAPEKQRITEALTAADARETAERFKTAYVEPLDRLRALQGQVGLDREVLNAQLEETARLGRELTPIEKEQIENGIRQGDQLQRQAHLLEDILAPLQDYQDQIAALNALLERGEISQTAFNGRLSELGRDARGLLADMPGQDPATGESYGDLAARAEEDARYAQELAAFESNRSQLLQMGIDYDALIEAAHRRHVQNMNLIDQARMQTAIQSAMSISESLLSIAEASAGKQSAIYKAMFIVSKAFAIADAIIKIQQGIANALSLPFPENLAAMATVAAAAASIVSSIQAVSLNLKDGGYISGPGGPRDDQVRVNASNGEFMVNAEATARHRPLLEAINNGTLMARSRRASNDNLIAANSNGPSFSFSFGDVVVQTGGGVTAEDGRAIGRDVKAAIGQLVEEKIRDAQRDGGALTHTRASVMTG